MESLILTVDGSRCPPSDFVRILKRFDPELRVRWGMGQAVPFPGWIIERRIPQHMKKPMHESRVRKLREQNPNWSDDGRFADQVVTDEHGNIVLRRAYDMLPDFHEVYRVMDRYGQPVMELGEFVIDYLRLHYERTLLGFPALGLRHHMADRAEREARLAREKAQRIEDAVDDVLSHRREIFHETEALVGAPRNVMEGTEFYEHHDRDSQGTLGEDSEPAGTDTGSQAPC